MKKIYLTLALLLTSAAKTWAQSERRLTKMATSFGSILNFNYNSEGKISQWTIESEDPNFNTVTYKAGEIIQTYREDNSVVADSLISKMENGKIVRETIKIMTTDGTVSSKIDFKLTYNVAGQLTEVIQENQLGMSRRGELIWADGNIIRVKHYYGSALVGETECGYDTTPGNRYINGLLSPISSLLSDEGVIPYAQTMENYYGVHIKNSITSVKYIPHVPRYFHWDANDNMDISYVRNGEGTVTQLVIGGNEPGVVNLEWSDTTTGIKANISTATQKETYYDINGMLISRLKKGINIIKGSDKQVRKVFVR